MTLAEYKSLTRDLPRPTAPQMEDFAEFVSLAHSCTASAAVSSLCSAVFFLDPAAGMQRAEASDGSIGVFEREKTGFHYSWIPTLEYRRRFGYLAFCRSRGTSVSLIGGGEHLIPSDDAPFVYDFEHARLLPFPMPWSKPAWSSSAAYCTPWLSGSVCVRTSSRARWTGRSRVEGRRLFRPSLIAVACCGRTPHFRSG